MNEIDRVQKAVEIFEKLLNGLPGGTRLEIAVGTWKSDPWDVEVCVQGGYEDVKGVERVLGIELVRDEGKVRNLGWLDYVGAVQGVDIRVYAVQNVPGCVIRRKPDRTSTRTEEVYELECSG